MTLSLENSIGPMEGNSFPVLSFSAMIGTPQSYLSMNYYHYYNYINYSIIIIITTIILNIIISCFQKYKLALKSESSGLRLWDHREATKSLSLLLLVSLSHLISHFRTNRI